jgi:RNA polymerase sigma-70 factor (ECF subfamily)
VNAEPIRVGREGTVERELVVRAQGGDHDAFARLVAGSIGRLTATARLILRDTVAAEDAVQDALVDAWRDLPGLRDPDRFAAWLNRILVRHCLDARRTRGRLGRIEVELPTLEPSVEDAQRRISIGDQLERGLRRLTPEQRTVLVLAYYLDLPLADAASALGIPVGTMKSRLNRAVAALRAALDADERSPIRAAEGAA